ncbi:MAG: hypothetical protein ABI333_05260 [bacterium]
MIVLLHGSYDGRASECRAWAREGAKHGWLLCPAGEHRKDRPPTADRWTYGRVINLLREIRAGLDALKQRHPGRVVTRDLTLIGFSLGALLAHEVALYSGGLFKRIVFVEGVTRLRQKYVLRLRDEGVCRVAYLCGEKTTCLEQTRRRLWYWESAGIPVRTFVLPKAGHAYGPHFDVVAARVLAWIHPGRTSDRGRN